MQRRLAAILAADVVGYSRLMGEDEAGTLEALRQLRGKLFEPIVAEHRGHVIKRMGDGWLVDFVSAVDAVNCALAVQEGLADQDRIKLRIGVHVGDIVHEDEDIYGDGVNIAARLQEIAAPGAVAISAFTHESVKSAMAQDFADAGARQLKNIATKVGIFTWGPGLENDNSETTLASSAGERPALIVLPFAMAGMDRETEWLADGLTDAVITALSRFSWFTVLARNTSYLYKNKNADIAELVRELGVGYVLEGNLRAVGARVRVSAQLIDAKTGGNIWAERFDGNADDPFEMEDKITRAILAELTPRLLGAEARRAQFGGDGGAWDLIMQGRGLLWHVNQADVARAQELFLKAIALEPGSGVGQSDLAWSYVYQRLYGWGADLEQVATLARKAADNAVAADGHDAFALAAASLARLLVGQSDDAIAFARRAIGLNPNLAVAQVPLSLGLFQQGCYEEAIQSAQTALELSPRDPMRSIMLAVRGVCLLMLGRHDDLLSNAKEMVRDYPGMPTGYRQLAIAYVETGHLQNARNVVDELLRLMPGHTAREAGRQVPFGENDDARQYWVQALIKAGLPA